MTSILKQPMKTVLLQGLILFVIMAGGVLTGLYIANEFGIVSWFDQNETTAETLKNNTTLKLDQAFPVCNALDENDQPLLVDSILADKNTIVAIVTNGCEACLELMYHIDSGSYVPDGFEVVLLTTDPEFFRETYDHPIYKITYDFLMAHKIEAYPTVFVTDEDAVLKVICTGYTESITPDLIVQSI